jgi:membrane-associated phospholipid phosphatase
MAARLHEHITNSRRLPFPVSLTHSRALELSARATGSFLLGTLDSSNTPSFPNAHAAVASACATVLGHFSGTHAAREFEHLASAIALSRESAGLNFRSDTAAGLALGRSVAREILLSA